MLYKDMEPHEIKFAIEEAQTLDLKEYPRHSVYFIASANRLVKIGLSGNVLNRVRGISNCSPIPVKLVSTMPGAYHTEEFVHSLFDDVRQHSEWFLWSPELGKFMKEYTMVPVYRHTKRGALTVRGYRQWK